jgi:excisionase family DNA binding protein
MCPLTHHTQHEMLAHYRYMLMCTTQNMLIQGHIWHHDSSLRRLLLDNLLSVEEAAQRLGKISVWTVRAWLSQGKLRRTKVGGRTMIRESELERVIEDGGKSPTPKLGNPVEGERDSALEPNTIPL